MLWLDEDFCFLVRQLRLVEASKWVSLHSSQTKPTLLVFGFSSSFFSSSLDLSLSSSTVSSFLLFSFSSSFFFFPQPYTHLFFFNWLFNCLCTTLPQKMQSWWTVKFVDQFLEGIRRGTPRIIRNPEDHHNNNSNTWLPMSYFAWSVFSDHWQAIKFNFLFFMLNSLFVSCALVGRRFYHFNLRFNITKKVISDSFGSRKVEIHANLWKNDSISVKVD